MITRLDSVCRTKDGFCRSPSVALANLVFQGCDLEASDASIIRIASQCASDDDGQGVIKLHHVTFRRNTLNGSKGLSAIQPSCSSVEMVDVVFLGNACGDRCFAALAVQNVLNGMVLRRNRRLSDGDSPIALMSAPSGSSTAVSGLVARSNELSILRAVESNVDIADADIEKSSRDPPFVFDRAVSVVVTDSSFRRNSVSHSGGAILANATELLSISRCIFEGNVAESGAAIASIDGNLTIGNCSFHHNIAKTDAGALHLSNGRLELRASVFESNNATGNGGAVFLQESRPSTFSEVQCRNNTAGDGGCLSASAARELIIENSAFENNTATNGGAIRCDRMSLGMIANSVMNRNVALGKGGGISLVASPRMEIRNCSLNNNSAEAGGGLDSRSSRDVIVNRCTFSGNSASLNGGGAWIFEQSSVLVQASNWTMNRAASKGGGIGVEESNLTAQSSTVSHNTAQEGSGVRTEFGDVDLNQVALIGNRASASGGGMTIQHGRATIVDCHIAQNIANVFAGGLNIAKAPSVIQNTTFIENSALNNRGGGLACFDSNMSIADSEFRANKAHSSGGAFHIVFTMFVAAERLIIRDNQCTIDGGGIGIAERSGLNISDSTIQNNTAAQGGAIFCLNSTVHATDCNIHSNRATNGGGIFVTKGSRFFLENSTSISNKAQSIGGAITSFGGSTTRIKAVTFSDNEAQGSGGCVHAQESSVFVITDARIVSGRAHQGGGIHAQSNSAIALYDSIIRNNTATKEGGGLLLDISEGNVNETVFEGNVASIGGSVFLKNSTVQVFSVTFENSRASRDGGSIAANANSSVMIVHASLLNSSAATAGALWLLDSDLAAYDLRIQMCRAVGDGGGILANGTSIVLCSDCVFNDNVAGVRGGAISFSSGASRSLALQINNGSFESNAASLGGNHV